MATCKDCLHYDVCVIIEHSVFGDEDYLSEFGCEDFKNRENWTEKKHGRWIKNWCDNNMIGHMYEECSECGCSMLDTNQFWDSKHCPNCGLIMDGDSND